jgi:hypothetical protein
VPLFIYSLGFFWKGGDDVQIRGNPSTCACGGVRVEEFIHLKI